MFELVENIFFTYADDSTLLAVVRKPADRPAVAACLNRELGMIQEWCSHWCMILNPNKTKVYSFVDPGLWALGVISEGPQPRHPWLEVWQKAHLRRTCAWYCFLCLSENWYFEVGETYICGHLSVRSIVAIFHLFSQSLNIVLRCVVQLLSPQYSMIGNVTFSYLTTRCIWWPGFVSRRIYCHCVIDVARLGLVCCTRLIRTV